MSSWLFTAAQRLVDLPNFAFNKFVVNRERKVPKEDYKTNSTEFIIEEIFARFFLRKALARSRGKSAKNTTFTENQIDNLTKAYGEFRSSEIYKTLHERFESEIEKDFTEKLLFDKEELNKLFEEVISEFEATYVPSQADDEEGEEKQDFKLVNLSIAESYYENQLLAWRVLASFLTLFYLVQSYFIVSQLFGFHVFILVFVGISRLRLYLLKYRIDKGYFGTTSHEARILIEFILDNKGDLDPPDGGYKKLFPDEEAEVVDIPVDESNLGGEAV